VSGCQRGEDRPLAYYTVYWKLDAAPDDAWLQQIVSGASNRLMISGLVKESEYVFKVSAHNSEKEGLSSLIARATPVPTIPLAPPRPLASAASPIALVIFWSEPEDKGTQNVTEHTFRLIITPRRDGQAGDEVMEFPVERSTILTGLEPNSQYLVWAQFQANPMFGFGLRSPVMVGFTTPLAPRDLAIPGNVTGGRFLLTWSWEGVEQGNVTIIGYRVFYESTDGLVSGLSYCMGGASRRCTLWGFVNGKTYLIRMAASNDPRLETNYGMMSDALEISTPGSLPNVYSVTVDTTRAYDARVSWVGDGGGQAITAVAIRIKRESDPWLEAEAVEDTAATSAQIGGLGANLDYQFIVIIRSAAPGPGTPCVCVGPLSASGVVPTCFRVDS
jgi:hypothetical protein